MRVLAVLLSLTLSAFGGGVTDCIPFRDGKDCLTNPGCGYAGGWWSALETNALVTVELTAPNQTKLWSLHQFSAGYVYSSQSYFDEHVAGFVGGVDLPLNLYALTSVSNAFASCRRNGGTVIPRFAYTWDGWGGVEPRDFNVLLEHIRQLAELCGQFSDIIPAVECGMIGAYGEMHTSSYADRDHARQITSAWLDGLPSDIGLLVRAPCYVLYEAGAATASDYVPLIAAGGESDRLRRIGFYNDGYLGTDGDYGTWGAGSRIFTRDEGRAFLKPRRLPYGGEFATVSSDYFDANVHLLDPTRHNIVAEWYDTHLSYLRTIRSTGMTVYKKLAETTFSAAAWAFDGMPNLGEYEGENLQKFCEDHMGYRYIVRGLTARRGRRDCRLKLTVENTGFGPLLFPETLEILLTKGDETTVVPASGPDLRVLLGGATMSVPIRFLLPDGLPVGDYDVSLRIRVPVKGETTADAPKRVIALANEGSYDAATKANRLCTITFDGTADDVAVEPWFRSDAAETSVIGGTWERSGADFGRFTLAEALGPNCDGVVTLDSIAGFVAELPAAGPIGFGCLLENGQLVPYGCTADGWRRLEGPELSEGESFKLTITLSRPRGGEAPTVVYAANGEAFRYGGVAALAVSESALRALALELSGPGRHGELVGQRLRQLLRGAGFIVE